MFYSHAAVFWSMMRLGGRIVEVSPVTLLSRTVLQCPMVENGSSVLYSRERFLGGRTVEGGSVVAISLRAVPQWP